MLSLIAAFILGALFFAYMDNRLIILHMNGRSWPRWRSLKTAITELFKTPRDMFRLKLW